MNKFRKRHIYGYPKTNICYQDTGTAKEKGWSQTEMIGKIGISYTQMSY